MNAARPHTDGERHNGDTTRIQPTIKEGNDPMTARDFAASIYLIQNQDRPETEWDVIPEGVTAEDVERAIKRQSARREELRRAIEETGTRLRAPIPKREHTPADQRVDPFEEYTGRVPFWYGVLLIVAALLMAWGIFDLAMRLRALLGGVA